MMWNKLLWSTLLVVLTFGCKNDALEGNSEKSLEAIQPKGGSVADIVRNPVTADQPADTVNVAKLTFEAPVFDFGEVDEGTVVAQTFTFTNTGKVPLVISDARSTCGCTVPEWPKEPIAPGEKGAIQVEFNTKGKTRQQNKPVTVTANTYPAQTQIYINGFVRPENEG